MQVHMQVMYMLKCKFNMICKLCMLMQVCECLCKLCVCLNACLTCYASYENDYMQVQHVMQDMCMIMCKFGLNVVGLIYAHICKLTSS